jgi:predicted transcriptional regulator
VPPQKRKVIPISIRLPEDLHAEMKALADKDYRLLTQEIVFALRQFVESRRENPQPPK